ncbi:MAG: hypothetical protein C0617_14495 [Desulfuromonas sp.]|uniref:efflux RND transporter periplasmic adaptor subunit n=1 Tax=Desulfuromonas sp. TaxID=892 RepID=UPI000CB0ECEA|nr:efflux RND transporter periplasmic adaptor subunit [Desulfuromonas sp.]PLX82326.1 MAG: hypothetical protein C0617_14495 [Desulfuromonas sp.]
MKKPVSLFGVIALLAGAVFFWAGAETVPTALAIGGDPHAGHDHGREEPDAHAQEDIDDLFGDEDEHEGHGHAAENAGHEGHGHGALDGMCVEHGVMEAECGLCQGSHLSSLEPGQGMLVRLSSSEVAAKAGISTTVPQQLSLASGVALPARAEFNRNRFSRMTPLAPGTVRRVLVQPGTVVHKGDVLVEIATPEIATLKAQLLAARARAAQADAVLDREKDLLERGITSRQEYQQALAESRVAQSELDRFRMQLLNFGLSAGDLQQLLQGRGNGALVAVRAPFTGVVSELAAAVGENVSPGDHILTVVDPDILWVELSVPESRIYQVRDEAPVEARFTGLPGQVFRGRIFQVGAAVDERSRTLTALAEVKNPGHHLKAGMFGEVRLLGGDETEVLAVPADALQSIDGLSYLFLQLESDLFEVRRVETGAQEGGLVPIRSGLSAGERLVSAQGFALKSEILKARLGASCADH